jgi:hypothetical protein
MDDLDRFTYRNASPGGQILDTYTDSERARIRAILLNYMMETGLRSRKLYDRICAAGGNAEAAGLSFKTFQRFLANTVRVGDEAVAVCARFAKGLQSRPIPFHALGEALHALYKTPLPPDIAGSYNLVLGNLSTQISISPSSEGFALVTEKHTAPIKRLHDGVLVSIAPGEYLISSRDRLMLTPRYIATHANIAFVFDHARVLYAGEAGKDFIANFTRATE